MIPAAPPPSRPSFGKSAALALTLAGATSLLSACGGGGGLAASVPAPVPAPAPAPAAQNLTCDDSMKAAFSQVAPDTSVLLVKQFTKGDALNLNGTPSASTPVAQNDMCFVKLLVGPGNPGPTGAPSTSAGIGIEVWLPTKANWNKRIHVKGGGGWAGGGHTSLTSILPDSGSAGSAALVAGVEGAVSATTDTGHTISGGAFAMNPDGSINTVLWKDFAERGIHEMAVKTKALTKAYYGEAHKYAYFNGFSTGGRQGMKEAQVYPDDFDGILAGAPVMNWTRFITYETYPQVVQYRDLGALLTTAQQTTVGTAAVAACDVVGGVHLGYVPDPASCKYDPTQDLTVLCVADGGTNATAGCVNPAQAQAFNKIWYGMTPDGTVPSPAADNGLGIVTATNQRWYGLTRGTSLARLTGATPFTTSTDLVALELQDPTIATSSFTNAAKGNGTSGYMNLSYAQLDIAYQQGLLFQPLWANINTDNPDLTAFRNRGGKLLSYHGLADVLVPPAGTMNYYNRAASVMGGIPAMQNFYRLYYVPGMQHGFGNGSAVATANPPLPNIDLLYGLLTAWVEQGVAPPTSVEVSSSAATPPVKTRPLCLYPLKANFSSGDPNQASSYRCS